MSDSDVLYDTPAKVKSQAPNLAACLPDPASLVPQFKAWGKLTVKLFQQVAQKASSVHQEQDDAPSDSKPSCSPRSSFARAPIRGLGEVDGRAIQWGASPPAELKPCRIPDDQAWYCSDTSREGIRGLDFSPQRVILYTTDRSLAPLRSSLHP